MLNYVCLRDDHAAEQMGLSTACLCVVLKADSSLDVRPDTMHASPFNKTTTMRFLHISVGAGSEF